MGLEEGLEGDFQQLLTPWSDKVGSLSGSLFSWPAPCWGVVTGA